MVKIKKKSGWSWVTSAGVSAGIKFVTAGKGSFTLKDPSGSPTKFNYVSAGAGVSVGGGAGIGGSTEDDFSTGRIYVLDKCSGSELTARDIEGFCFTTDITVATLKGVSVTGMLLGIPGKSIPWELLKGTYPPATLLGIIADAIGLDTVGGALRSSAKALLIMFGENEGGQITAGVSGSIGYVWTGAPAQRVPTIVLPTGPEEVTMRSSSTSRDESDVIRLSGDMLFDFDHFDVKPAAEATLLKLAAHIRQKSPRYISVEGHTDAMGDAAYNMQLSGLRARSVARWLTRHNVVAASSINTKAWGKSRPAAPNKRPDGSDDAAGRAKNRRVEIWLIK